MRVLVTGAGGFVGNLAARALSDAGHEVLAVCRRPPKNDLDQYPGVHVVLVDLVGQDPLPGPLDAVVHCAAEIPARCPDESDLYRSNVEGTRRLFDHAMAMGASRIVYCSSMAVYGRINVAMVDPNTPFNEPATYGRSKYEGERILAALAAGNPGLRAVSIRLPGVVGIGSHDNFLSGVMPRILAGERIQATNPDALFNNLVHGIDLARFMADLVVRAPSGHRVLTIAADEPLPIRGVLSTLFTVARVPERVNYTGDDRSFLVSPEPARTLGFAVPTVSDILTRFAREVSVNPRPR